MAQQFNKVDRHLVGALNVVKLFWYYKTFLFNFFSSPTYIHLQELFGRNRIKCRVQFQGRDISTIFNDLQYFLFQSIIAIRKHEKYILNIQFHGYAAFASHLMIYFILWIRTTSCCLQYHCVHYFIVRGVKGNNQYEDV